jgi:hypothetical protein
MGFKTAGRALTHNGLIMKLELRLSDQLTDPKGASIRKLVIVMKSEDLKNIIESSGRHKPIPLTSICGHIVDKIIEFNVYGETSGGFGFGNQSIQNYQI